MKVAIVSGASAGLGLALARKLVEAGYEVLGIARSPRPEGLRAEWRQIDLRDVRDAAAALDPLDDMDGTNVTEALLVLNAGTEEPIGPIGKLAVEDIAAHVALNLTAPMAMTAAFLSKTEGWPAERRILAVSSGASRRATAYWSAYTASKSGLDGFVRAVNAEYSEGAGAAGAPRTAAVALAPGVIDTAMQQRVRETDFPTVSRYRGLKDKGELASADEAAARVMAYLARPGFGSVELDDVRNYE
ncbi:hypothetical protein LA66_04920 [Aureimonas altamirensis]|uniref:Short-chain dehydrogenase n=1 Tax=Aureimonas altamirensis TaxID=370622 RepID=A0A0B1Q6F1_9HYPH|nr:SDR family NAD(P)-dependent oxidoreductase [Aureimonas altamirensis]KHJ55964.1 hypothetical protein LA66_04920 [Aureimonas altamirensis]